MIVARVADRHSLIGNVTREGDTRELRRGGRGRVVARPPLPEGDATINAARSFHRALARCQRFRSSCSDRTHGRPRRGPSAPQGCRVTRDVITYLYYITYCFCTKMFIFTTLSQKNL
ncbi:unnamed protein product [Arctia plantaginis]|uniref:Uncharacterized protein n=1 Tax=Arctia plantaginis TaxID=874455 RepID=A0A8S1AUK7_ARCPL|nr:unnamed protein product [Arctia plantaginis]